MVSPIIDVIDWRTFQYNATQWPVRGVFNWQLDFHWESYTLLQDTDPDSAVGALRWVNGGNSLVPTAGLADAGCVLGQESSAGRRSLGR